MKKSLEDYIYYLFSCNFKDENFDPEDKEEHLKESWNLSEDFSWSEIFPSLIKYLHEYCHTSEEVINFVNLYFYYGFGSNKIDDPISFISYLYYMVNIDQYWEEAGELFDSLSIQILTNNALIDIAENPYYSPLKDERILNGISCWKEQEL
jgi:hypothetical protein